MTNGWDSGATLSLFYLKNSNWEAFRVRNVVSQDSSDTKVGRSFMLGISEAGDTTQTGNNESHKAILYKIKNICYNNQSKERNNHEKLYLFRYQNQR